MKRNRNPIQEILDRRSRGSSESEPFSEASISLTKLFSVFGGDEYGLLKKSESSHELFKYIPVAVVAIIQSYLSAVIASLIDADDDGTYRSNARRIRNINFGIDAVLAIGGKTITAGEFISHNLRFNSISAIDEIMSVVLGYQVFKTIKNVHKQRNKPKELALDIGTLKRAFEKRHIVCHEFGRSLTVTNLEAFGFIYQSLILLLSIDQLLIEEKSDKLMPNRDKPFHAMKVKTGC
jgi:hypothetical protein